MGHKSGLSGSTILSDPAQFHKLFERGLPHIEIGEFTDRKAFEYFEQMNRKEGTTFGIHSPLLRGDSKYDLIDEVIMSPKLARDNFEKEVSEMAELGAEYVLVHFPYFKNEPNRSPEPIIEEGLRFLSRLQTEYQLPIVCEPKLGPNRTPHNIEFLHHFPRESWEQYGLSLCIDIGDYLMATKDQWRVYLEPLLPYTKVVHLHNVKIHETGYYWVPLHPSFEQAEEYFNMEPCLELLMKGRDKYFIFEHTPHTNPGDALVQESVQWIQSMIDDNV